MDRLSRTRGSACQSLLDSAPMQAAPLPASTGTQAPPPAPSEIVERPDPGLARGRWEAPRWAFALVAALTVLGGLVWIALAVRARRSRA
jgi:hypothetical protein